MKKSFSLFLSLRYLRPKRTFVSVITVISVLGVMLGVWILTAVIAIMTGYNVEMRDTILGFQPHVVIQSREYMQDWPDIYQKVKKHPDIVDAAPFTRGQLALDFDNRVQVIRQRGMNPIEGEAIYEKLKSIIIRGELDLDDDNAIIGRALAEGMGIGVGDTITLFSLANAHELLEAQQEDREPENMILPQELTVTGIYESGRWDFDSEIVFVPLEIGQMLYKLGPAAHGIALHIADPYRAELVKRELAPMIDSPNEVMTWIDLNKALFDAVALERLIMYFLLFMIMVVAGFCIMNTMITVTTQKRREIGLLKAVGARTSQIVGVFLGQGIAVGLFGTVTGLLAAFLFLLFRKNIVEGIAKAVGLDVFSPEIYMLYELPAHLTVVDIAVISGGAFLACAVSSLMPAFFAARLDAAKALRNEASV